jgi:hypothetical protein
MTLTERALATANDLERQFVALPGDEDLQQQLAARQRKRDELISRVVALRSDATTVTSLEPRIAAEIVWRDHLIEWRRTLEHEQLAFPARIYDHDDRELGRQRSVKLSIQAIDQGIVSHDAGWSLETLRLGQLMRDSGFKQAPPEPNTNQSAGPLPWLGALPDVERRITDLQARQAQAQTRLDDALMDDAARAAKSAAEATQRAEAAAAAAVAPRRITRSDFSQYDRYPDGRVVEVEQAVTT